MQSRFSRVIITLLLVTFLSAMLVACVIGGGLYLWARQSGLDPITAIRLKINLTRYEDTLQSSAGDDDSYRKFEVQSGDTAQTIGDNLLIAGLITDPNLFVNYVRYYGLDSQLQAGTYFLQQTQTLEEIAYALTNASTASIPFRSLPGWRIEEVAAVVDTNPLLSFSGSDFLAVIGPGTTFPPEFKARMGIPDLMSNGQQPSLEGFALPDDYVLQPDATAFDLRDAMIEKFNANVTDDMIQAANAQGLTLYEVVTLASIVQRETQVQDEAPVVASVYLNRLRLPMKLDADPTVQYAIGNTRDASTWWPNITQADYYGLAGIPNQSYSTYLNEGLPPGPIASPSLANILAVLNAPQTEYFYFRRGCADDGRHEFFLLEEQADHANFTCP
ncbi:MAG: endolytic transglycosylase MltG [Anaerolineae bacterium]|nr:endolytic transglycosylase MltG [Anaerolineae bacterium]